MARPKARRRYSTSARHKATVTIRALLRRAFPDTWFSVTGGGSRIAWTDEGPIVERVRGMLVAAGIEARRCDGELRLFMLGHEIRFDRFNLAERKHFGPHHISLIMPRRHGLRRSLNPDQ